MILGWVECLSYLKGGRIDGSFLHSNYCTRPNEKQQNLVNIVLCS